MKSLKPNNENSGVMVATDNLVELRERVALLASTISALSDEIAEIETALDSDTIAKESGHFDNIEVTNSTETHTLDADVATISSADITSLNSSSANISALQSDSITGTTATINSVTTESLTTENATISDTLNADTVSSNDIEGTNAAITNITATNITADEVNATTWNAPNITAVSNVESDNIIANTATITDGAFTQLSADTAELTGAAIDQLYNSKKLFDQTKFIITETQNEDPYYIKIPHFTSGSYKLVLRDPTDTTTLFSFVVVNSIDAPIVTYTKTTDEALNKILYDTVNKDIYLQSYEDGKLYWSADTFTENSSPSTYDEMPVTTDTEYITSAMKRVVILGNESAYYGLDILGQLKASIFVDSSKEGTPLFYSGPADGLISQLNAYLPQGHSISVTGYVRDDVTEKEYSLQTITRTEAGNYILYLECEDGVGTDSMPLTALTPAHFGLFTTTYAWDQNING